MDDTTTSKTTFVQAVCDLVPSTPVWPAQLWFDVQSFSRNLYGCGRRKEIGCSYELGKRLAAVGYNVVCRRALGAAATPGSNVVQGTCFRPLQYEFLVVKCNEGSLEGMELFVDPFFREQFEIPLPTKHYAKLLESVPMVFVGLHVHLIAIVELLCAEMAASLAACGFPVPAWCCIHEMLSKWLSTHVEDVPFLFTTSPLEECLANPALAGALDADTWPPVVDEALKSAWLDPELLQAVQGTLQQPKQTQPLLDHEHMQAILQHQQHQHQQHRHQQQQQVHPRQLPTQHTRQQHCHDTMQDATQEFLQQGWHRFETDLLLSMLQQLHIQHQPQQLQETLCEQMHTHPCPQQELQQLYKQFQAHPSSSPSFTAATHVGEEEEGMTHKASTSQAWNPSWSKAQGHGPEAKCNQCHSLPSYAPAGSQQALANDTQESPGSEICLHGAAAKYPGSRAAATAAAASLPAAAAAAAALEAAVSALICEPGRKGCATPGASDLVLTTGSAVAWLGSPSANTVARAPKFVNSISSSISGSGSGGSSSSSGSGSSSINSNSSISSQKTSDAATNSKAPKFLPGASSPRAHFRTTPCSATTSTSDAITYSQSKSVPRSSSLQSLSYTPTHTPSASRSSDNSDGRSLTFETPSRVPKFLSGGSTWQAVSPSAPIPPSTQSLNIRPHIMPQISLARGLLPAQNSTQSGHISPCKQSKHADGKSCKRAPYFSA